VATLRFGRTGQVAAFVAMAFGTAIVLACGALMKRASAPPRVAGGRAGPTQQFGYPAGAALTVACPAGTVP
jgi:hypothetical protein